MITSEKHADHRVVLRVRGSFDAAAAHQLHDALGKAAPDSRVLIDFSQARDSQDLAVAMLAQDLANAPGRASLLGLCQHQRRLLRYFGIDDEGSEPARGPEADAFS